MQESGPKRAIDGVVVKVLVHRRQERGMELEPFASRCVQAGEVHELVTTDHTDSTPGTRVDRVGFLGFAEVLRAGVIDRGDEVWVGRHRVGSVLGFDSCHLPNHYNIVICASAPRSGADLELQPEMRVRIGALLSAARQ